MLFNSIPFLILLLITFVIYYIPRLSKYQIPILILSSLIFYSFDSLPLVLLLLFSATVNVVFSYYIVYGNPSKRKILAVTSVVLNLAGLAFFKYGPLFSHTFFDPKTSIGDFFLSIPLPIGISFFTFEGISLLIDVWKEKHGKGEDIVNKSLFQHAKHTLFFISFFPHLIAGPILKAHDFYPQIKQKIIKDINWNSVFKLLIVGYFLKMVIADNLKDLTHLLNQSYLFSSITLFFLMIGFAVQIFADFAGYSLIAIGLAKLFGYNFQMNFNFPYIATSFKDFWKRWHISLSTFLMEYLYFPLGGNRKGKTRTYFNLMTTMVLGGLWHGADWTYALWGGLHGGALAVERFVNDRFDIRLNRATRLLKGLFVFLYVSVAFLLFKLSMPEIKRFCYYFINNAGDSLRVIDIHLILFIIVYTLPIIIYHAIYLYKERKGVEYLGKVEPLLYSLMLFLIITNSGTSGSFIYFQF